MTANTSERIRRSLNDEERQQIAVAFKGWKRMSAEMQRALSQPVRRERKPARHRHGAATHER